MNSTRIRNLRNQLQLWRLVGLASSIVGLLCYALSPSFKRLIGGWNSLKFFLYGVLVFAICTTIAFAKQSSLSSRCGKFKAHVGFAVLMLTSVYSFLFDKALSGKPDILSMVSNAAFALMSLSMSRVVKVGFEVGLSSFFLGFFAVQLMTINLMLILVAIIYGYPLFIIHSSSDSQSVSEVGSGDEHVILDIDMVTYTTAEGDPKVRYGPKRFSLRELQVATDNFSDTNLIGRGGFDEEYKGRLADGSLVAVKRLKKERTPGVELQFQTEAEMISMAVHRNILPLRGFCLTPTERLLVCPYMPNGSVASWLRERPAHQNPLDWPTRKRIALGTARGVSYFHDHCDPKIIHCDVKAANILLDEDFEAVVGGFGWATLMDYNDTYATSTTAVRGTIGHIAPEYIFTGRSSEKTDVFGYGMMLLELITGQRAVDLACLAYDDDVMFLDWVKGLWKDKMLKLLVDPDLHNNYVDAEVEQLIKVALLCTQDSPADRPRMSEVVRLLEGDGTEERWDKWQKVEVLPQEVELTPHIIDTNKNL